MVVRTLDRLVFGFTLLVSLQLPQFATHYQQYLAGAVSELSNQVSEYQAIAHEYGFTDVNTMIIRHKQNSEPSVRADAELKELTLTRYEEYHAGLEAFQHHDVLAQLSFALTPSHRNLMTSTFEQFVPGVPLTLGSFAWGVVAALLLNTLLLSPIYLVKQMLRSKKNAKYIRSR